MGITSVLPVLVLELGSISTYKDLPSGAHAT
jgi:hypothetical protein